MNEMKKKQAERRAVLWFHGLLLVLLAYEFIDFALHSIHHSAIEEPPSSEKEPVLQKQVRLLNPEPQALMERSIVLPEVINQRLDEPMDEPENSLQENVTHPELSPSVDNEEVRRFR